jgi:hypothetical protein
MVFTPMDLLISTIILFLTILAILSYLYLKDGLSCLDNEEYTYPPALCFYNGFEDPWGLNPYWFWNQQSDVLQKDEENKKREVQDEDNSTTC